MTLISCEEAVSIVCKNLKRKGTEWVNLGHAQFRVLCADLAALCSSPSRDASSMDGYAVRFEDLKIQENLFVVGTSAAGKPFCGSLQSQQAVRIFTGALMPEGSDTVVIQENTTRDGDCIKIDRLPHKKGQWVRPKGLDFSRGDVLLKKGHRMGSRDVALAANMNHDRILVASKPRVGVLSSGDELQLPGTDLTEEKVANSNSYGLMAFLSLLGAEPVDLGTVGDDAYSIDEKISEAKNASLDLLVTTGGASVGERDLLRQCLSQNGYRELFWRIALRPGKPSFFGFIGELPVLGLPGNPVSAFVTGVVLLAPAIGKMLGQSGGLPMHRARIAHELPKNDERTEFLRAEFFEGDDGQRWARTAARQESSMLSTLHEADGLLIRPAFAEPLTKGDICDVIIFLQDW